MRIITLANQKGGVGKTTTAFNLAHALTGKGKSVLMVDLDAQTNLSTWAGIVGAEPSMVDLFVKRRPIQDILISPSGGGPDIAPATEDLAGVDLLIATRKGRGLILREAMRGITYDFVLIDCPPSLGLLTINALNAATEVIIPTETKSLSLSGILPLIGTIEAVQQGGNPNLRLTGVLPCMFDGRTTIARETVEAMRESADLRGKVFRTIIRENVKLAEGYSHRAPIFETAPDSYGAHDYEALAKEILKR